MLTALYPQKGLPYRYLWPFLRNTWDSEVALRTISKHGKDVQILLLTAQKDEVVPQEEGATLLKLCNDLGFNVKHESIPNALHTELIQRQIRRSTISSFLRSTIRRISN
jgi:hypothetical protein